MSKDTQSGIKHFNLSGRYVTRFIKLATNICHWALENSVRYLLPLFPCVKLGLSSLLRPTSVSYDCLSLMTLSSLLLALRRSIRDKRQLRGGFAGNAHPRAKDLNNEKPPERGLYFYKTSLKLPDLRSLNNMHSSEELLAFKFTLRPSLTRTEPRRLTVHFVLERRSLCACGPRRGETSRDERRAGRPAPALTGRAGGSAPAPEFPSAVQRSLDGELH